LKLNRKNLKIELKTYIKKEKKPLKPERIITRNFKEELLKQTSELVQSLKPLFFADNYYKIKSV